MEWRENTGYLQFDNLNFKLAVIQHLAYDLEVLNVNSFLYPDILEYYEQLEIPLYLAGYVEKLFIRIDDKIYFDINPKWNYEDARFDISGISFREAQQFSRLKEISFVFTYGRGHEKQISKTMKPLGILVSMQQKETSAKKEYKLPFFASVLVLLAAAAAASFLLIYFHTGQRIF